MSSSSIASETPPSVFYIGHHESRRRYVVTEDILQHAQEHNYDMLTSPITNDNFHSRVLTLLSAHLRALEEPRSSSASQDVAATLSDISSPPSLSALSLHDTFMSPSEPVSQLILTTSPWIDLASPDPLIAEISRQVLLLEVAYACFCGASNVLVQGPQFRYGQAHTEGLSQYARAIQEALATSGFVQLQILLPMTQSTDSEKGDDMGDLSKFARAQYLPPQHSKKKNYEPDLFGSWDSWNLIRSLNRYSNRLSVALIIPRHLPPPSVQSRWFSEPLRVLSIPGSSFYHNAHSETSLTQPQKQLISHYMRHRNQPWILLTDVGPLPGFEQAPRVSAFVEQFDSNPSLVNENSSVADPTPAEASHRSPPPRKKVGLSSHLNYVRHLQHKQPPKPPMERFGAGYQDYLQNPLQPLADNLESITYEVFEKDPIKYDWYENAISEALMDWKRLKKPASGTNGRIVIAVAGAGRGPLVTRALKASVTAGAEIEMWAVEKNHNAFVVLQRHNVDDWNRKVNLVQSDMRSWKGPIALPLDGEPGILGPHSAINLFEEANQTLVPIDILVSELLGSFGDNELSPECLDGIQHLLNPAHGLSIPCSYTAHLTPISAPKIHSDILARSHSGDEEAPQIPYVVMLHAIDYLSTSANTRSESINGKYLDSSSSTASASIVESTPVVLQTWEFSHPLPPKWLQQTTSGTTHNRNTHNERFAWLEFPCKNRGVCHGLAGYFETVLYARAENADGDAGRQRTGYKNANEKGPGCIELSTNPLTMDKKSKDMISWFPIYFPLKTPLYIPDDSLLAISMWRKTDGRGVWYEWLVEAFMFVGSPAKRIRLGASELHSSTKNACMM